MAEENIIGSNVARERKAKGWSPQRLATEVGVKLFTIQQIENGNTKRSKFLPQIANKLGVPLSKIDPDYNESNTPEISSIIPKRELVGARDLPIYATTEGGEGILVMSSEPVDLGDRPTTLTHVGDAYGVIVTGDSMVPAIRPGDVAIIHPHQPPRRGGLCVFRSLRGGEFYSTIKEYVGPAPDGWRVKRYQPEPREFVLKRKDWQECHVVVAIHRR